MVIKNQKKTLSLILIIVIIIVGVLYYFYSLGNKTIDTQLLTSDINQLLPAGQNLGLTQSGQDILKTLNVLNSVKLDIDFFKQDVFQGLVDFSQELPFEEKGRLNPFREIGI
ncbi:MAG: hypothetical protein COU71_01685 [Parcubacteria group bacterium CG10_big_fil_rev_8_21_14_0_10_38_31]|nr:MAG: hypothetical protein COU71_01685 [Parcubacteria group bacterium CG10_big_fil_rev_8_21_14_0_10_38_31]